MVDDWTAPTIQNDVVMGPDQFILIVTQLKKRQTHQRRLGEFEATSPIFIKAILKTRILLRFRQRTPVVFIYLQIHFPQDALQRFVLVLPDERGSEDRVPLDDMPPRALKLRHIQLAAQEIDLLLDMHTRSR